MLEHRFRAEKTGRDRHSGHTMRVQLGRHVQREAFDRELHCLRQRIAAGKQRVAFGHLDDEAAASADHQRRGMLRRGSRLMRSTSACASDSTV